MFDLHVKGKDGERYLLRPGFGTSTPTSGGPSAAEANRLLHSFDAKTLQAIYQHFFGLGRPIDPFEEQKAFPQGNGVSRQPSSPIAQNEDVNLYAARYQFGDGINKPLFLAFISKRIVVDPAPLSNYENEELGGNLKVKIRQALQEIINQEKLEAAQIDAEYQKRTRLGKVWAHGKAAGEGLGEAAWGLAVWVKDVGEVAFYTSPIRQAYLTASHAIEAGELSKDVWAESHKEFLTGAKKELVDVLGFDPSTITMDQLYTAFDVAELVYSDDSVRNIFYRFTKDYAAAQHSTEIAEFAGGGVFEIILTVILAVFTGGAGAVASMAGKARHMKHFSKVGDLVMEYAKVLKRRKQILEENNGKSNKGDLSDLTTNESVEAKTPEKATGQGSHSGDDNPGKNQAEDGQGGTTDTNQCSPANSHTCTNGEPISMVTGEELLEQQDFVFKGPLPLAWKRTYRTTNPRNRTLGFGWGHPACENLFILDDGQVRFTTLEGRYILIPEPKLGETTVNKAEGLRLTAANDGFVLQQKGAPDKFFQGYGARKKITHWVDNAGNALSFNYDNDLRRRLENISSSWGQRLDFTYNGQGFISAIELVSEHKDSNSETATANSHTLVKYGYDEHGDLIAITDANGHRETFEYTNHIVTKRTLKTGFSFYFEWDKFTPEAKCIRQWGDKNQYDYRFEWDDANKRSKAIDSNGGVLSYQYNDRGQIIRETDAEGGETLNSYDDYGRLLSTRNPNGDATQYRYNVDGDLIQIANALNQTQNFAYNDEQQLSQITDALGNQWQREYTESGQLKRQTDPEGNTVDYQYNAQGLPTQITRVGRDGYSISQMLNWDERGQLIEEIKPDGQTTQYQYDDLGNITAVTTPVGTHQYRYDSRGNVTLAIDPTGGVTRFAYNANDQLVRYTDISGRTTEYFYEGLAQVTKKVLPNGLAIHYEYDKERNLTGLINENGERYTLEYDRNERLVREIGFDGREQRYQYDKAGFLVAHIDGSPSNAHEAQQVTTTFSRDLLGRLTEKHSPDGDISTFAYDNAGRLTEANNQSQTLRFHYDALGRLIEEQQGNETLRHQYNSQGLRTQTQLPSGEALNYAFNAIGQLQAACFKDSTGNEQIITELKHNPLGLIAERQQGQLTSEYDYDAMGRLAEHRVLSQSQKHAVIQRHYHYTSSGNLEGIDDLNKGSTRYFYDAIDRLKEVEGFVNEQFDFDPANNLIQQSEQPKADHQAADSSASSEKSQRFDEHSNVFSLDKAREEKQAQGNRLAFQGDRHFTYDQRGNLIKEARGKNGKLITSYTYNAQNQLVEVDNCGTKTQYQYDALGRRTKKTSTEQETEFLWDGDVLLSETQHLKTETQEQATAKIYVFEPNTFKPLAQIQNNEIYHYHLDHLGTPQELTNNCGDIVWSARYKTYGNLALKDVDDVENNLRFQGQYFDQETGLHYNRHRYYNPNTGQFTQQDPIGLLGGLNNYQYAPNPVGWVDPFGQSCKEEKNLLKRVLSFFKKKDNKHSTDLVPNAKNRLAKSDFENLTNSFSEDISRSAVGDMISENSAFKNVYNLGNDLVLAIPKDIGGAIEQLDLEMGMLTSLNSDLGVDVVQFKSGYRYDGKPAIIMEKMLGSDRDFSWYDFDHHEIYESDKSNEILLAIRSNKEDSIASLKDIRDKLFLSEREVVDIQFLIAPDGTFVLNDPLEVKTDITADYFDTRERIDSLMDLVKGL
ncbi:RHS repeat-associated core domain-containing protein [Sessilibacter corallicola]|uniref:RHS repeat-associated core domain-containing protein n=1 Tax=Sessilibacter corallicola TaxID=2904075 RepID=UPI001E2D2C46|nr:RHS repeat-associated core domain-containing protein [Sessilibacter corallicola]MCE2030449.1 DUF6531 domain-containing protein [Sessilibacter corallicola]